MRFRVHLRVLLAMGAVLAGFSSAAIALGHGIDHAREAHQTSGHHHVPSHHDDHDEGLVIRPADSHGHTVVQVANAKRINDDPIGPTAPTEAAVWFSTHGQRGASPVVSSDRGADRATGPPPQTRAPPLL